MVTQPTLDIVDIHTHLWPPAWGPGGARRKPGATLAADILNRIANPAIAVAEVIADPIDDPDLGQPHAMIALPGAKK